MHRFPFVRSLVVLLFAGLPTLSGCGSGTAALVSGSGSGGGNAATVLSGFQLQGAKVSPATIAFTVVDEEADPAHVELLYALPGEAPRPMTHLTPLTAGLALDGNVATATSSANGVTHRLSWDFTAEAGVPSDGSFVAGAGILARIEGGTQGLILGANADAQGLGNDAPTLLDPTPELAGGDEALGVVPVDFSVTDSSSDPVDVLVEYAIVEQGQPLEWLVATPAGSEPNPIPGIEASPTPTVRTFFWDTNVDLAKLERQVVLRLTPSDDVVEGSSVSTAEFRVDNNAPPSLVILGDVLHSSEDSRFGIPIPYKVFDAEEDAVEVVFQWTREGVDFPELPDGDSELDAILADEGLRRAYRICTEYHGATRGRAWPVDALTLRLPELATSAGHLLAGGLVGSEIELLREATVLESIDDHWETNPLEHPVGTRPVGDGTSAMVLEGIAGGGWTILEVDLASGAVLRVVASSSTGEPTALAAEPFDRSLLIATLEGGAWCLERVQLPTGERSLLAMAEKGAPGAPIRGVASIGANAAVLTVDSSLLRVDYPPGDAPRVRAIADDLDEPWGVVVDPRDPERLLVSEREAEVEDGFGRILQLDLRDHTRRPLSIDTSRLHGDFFERPGPLVTRPGQDRIMTVARTGLGGEQQLVCVQLGATDHAVAFPLGDLLPPGAWSVSAGADGLGLLTTPSPARALAVGGVEQRRFVQSVDPSSREVILTRELRPQLAGERAWRLVPSGRRARGTPGGSDGRFVWDSSDAASLGGVLVRGVPRDKERGTAGSQEAPFTLGSRYQELRLSTVVSGVTRAPLASLSSPLDVRALDLEGDGDLDLVSANGVGLLTIFLRTETGEFDPDPIVLGDPVQMMLTVALEVADLDLDGD
ncbi:MAG: VCBS repeat-containing protein, partial [Acidimicrobiales bacterium]|nr:VCBS repeat-containing protein [Acidimicrobiales bacterium]